jgi:hypothetical protein
MKLLRQANAEVSEQIWRTCGNILETPEAG